MNKILFILLLVLNVLPVFSQKEILVKGKVFDSETGNPVPEVHVFIKGKTSGTITGENGSYSIYINEKKDTLVYSHLQYKTYDTIFTTNTLTADILLEPMISMLPDAIVKPVINISKGMMLDVTDYYLIGDSVLYSGYCYNYRKNKNPWMILKSPSGDTIYSECTGIEGRFYKDCFGNLHYLTNKTAFQLIIENDSVKFAYPSDIREFESVMYNCETEMNGKVFFSQFSDLNQMLIYYCIDKETYEAETFRIIADRAKLDMLAFEKLPVFGKANLHDPEVRFAVEMFYKPVFAPLIKVGDKIMIINYNDSRIEKYDSNLNQTGTTPIHFHNTRYCKNELIVDDATGKIYAVFKNKGKTSVKEIFPDEGTVGDEIAIPDFYWIDNVKVHNNKLYFLYREKLSSQLRGLYRMNLD